MKKTKQKKTFFFFFQNVSYIIDFPRSTQSALIESRHAVKIEKDQVRTLRRNYSTLFVIPKFLKLNFFVNYH